MAAVTAVAIVGFHEVEVGDEIAFIGRPDESLDAGPWYSVTAVDQTHFTYTAPYFDRAAGGTVMVPVRLVRNPSRRIRRRP